MRNCHPAHFAKLHSQEHSSVGLRFLNDHQREPREVSQPPRFGKRLLMQKDEVASMSWGRPSAIASGIRGSSGESSVIRSPSTSTSLPGLGSPSSTNRAVKMSRSAASVSLKDPSAFMNNGESNSSTSAVVSSAGSRRRTLRRTAKISSSPMRVSVSAAARRLSAEFIDGALRPRLFPHHPWQQKSYHQYPPQLLGRDHRQGARSGLS